MNYEEITLKVDGKGATKFWRGCPMSSPSIFGAAEFYGYIYFSVMIMTQASIDQDHVTRIFTSNLIGRWPF